MLRREALVWYRSPSPTRLLLGLALFGATASAGMALTQRPAPVPVPVPVPAAVPVPVAAPVPVPAPAPTRNDFSFVFRAGGKSWLMLADTGEDATKLPAHGPPHRFSEKEWAPEVIASVAPADLPAEHRRWLDRDVIVEGGCRARVTGFAIVALLIGDVSYASTDAKEWNAQAAFDSGRRLLAAELDGCHGGFARDASLGPIAEGVPTEDQGWTAIALEDFLESKPVAEAQKAFAAEGAEGLFHEVSPPTTQVVMHPVTGVTWVSVYAHHSDGCGGPQIDVWGLYAVGADGKLKRERIGALENISRIERLVDVDGDGRFEATTRDWLGISRELRDEAGKPIQRLEIPFYGCPC